jgi:hypothetical protein
MNRVSVSARAVVVLLFLSFLSFAAFAQNAGVVASFNGTLSSAAQQDRVTFEVSSEMYELNSAGAIDFVLLMRPEPGAGAPVDPGLISVEAVGDGSVKKTVRNPDTATSTDSIALVTLTPGTYEIEVRSERKTAGEYALDVLLAGDADADFKVDAADLQAIAALSGIRDGHATYSERADVDRNGVINGGDRQRAAENVGALFLSSEGDSNPLDESLPVGALALVGRSEDSFSSRAGGLTFSLAGAEFDNAPAETIVTVNGVRVPAGNLAIQPQLLTANVALAEGRNQISLKAYDTIGRPLYHEATVWAGSYTLRVNLVNPNGTAFTQQANVVAALTDDPSVTASGLTSSGTITFTNLPGRTILFKATGVNGNEIGTAGALGWEGVATIKMAGFNAPSTVSNNDFSLGTAGWVIGPGAVTAVIPHQEEISGFFTSAPVQSQMKVSAQAVVDQDLLVGTSGEGERSVARTFTTAAGTTAIKLRYRFITSEVPGGWYGTEFNDYYRVSIRSQQGGGSVSNTNSMNGLGLGAFNGGGETNWYEVTLPVDRAGDTIQAEAAVANVADGAFNSQVVIDFVEEIREQVRPSLSWNNTAGGLNLRWEVLGDRPLEQQVTIEVHFANGAGYGNRIGAAVFTHVLPAGTPAGPGGPVNVPGGDLEDDPAGTTHLVASTSPNMVGAIADVRINWGPNANRQVVDARLIDIIKDGLRAAGASNGTISSTARTAADQARAMFQNIVRTGAAAQLAEYRAPGQAVIRVYIAETAGMTPQQITANAAAIQAAMVTEINAQGPQNVSLHCADPAVISVVDVPLSAFNGTNRALFRNSVEPRVTRVLNENNVFHIEFRR